MHLRQLYQTPGKTVVTAHRGFSGRYPENTLLAFTRAVELGADIVEFDVRESADGELVVIHDATVDRTTNGSGPVASHTAAELKALNATYWTGTHDSGHQTAKPVGDATIPTLEEALVTLSGNVGLNIQVYTDTPEALKDIITLYRDHGLGDSAFLMLRSFAEAERVRSVCPDVAVCVGEERANLERHLAFGVDVLQPTKACLSDSYIRRIKETRTPANVFYANSPEDMKLLIDRGVPGIMTDVPDVLMNTINPPLPAQTSSVSAGRSGPASA
ncbi:MAG: hypothetical protein HN742_22185 [Lentisphaerae bacterium]|jgi:glycerophosphoryl diester phosphodiesterase|nr:hypothetical protein [Lentisphaerota bacterium]MBT4819344.1 hypothetical protein [Lentisphaerota bacterium]MBT5605268.1 hypothetical protein [Lentisphaerota bacterium]MBT7059247.1 hypothetical protein [Lentisphaerota bacterium]MBT7844602.1 hypothetical protein [Lentisphaerota bacterium]